MTGRAYLLPIAIAAAVGVPYVASDVRGPSSPSSEVRGLPPSVASGGLANRTTGFAGPYPQYGSGPVPWQSNPQYSLAVPPGPVGPMGSPHAGQIVAATPWTPVSPGSPASGTGDPHVPPAQAVYGNAANAHSSLVVSPPLPAHMLFRFDITPQWIIQAWPQVSSEVSDPPLAGLRTAVVTGTGIQDIAGSMTYYFDGTQQLQRIMFHGTTGDPAPLIQMVASHYQMQSEPALNGATYVARDKDRMTSVLHVRLMPLVRQSQPHRRYEIDLELNRPGGATSLSEAQAEMLEYERKLLAPPAQTSNTPPAR